MKNTATENAKIVETFPYEATFQEFAPKILGAVQRRAPEVAIFPPQKEWHRLMKRVVESALLGGGPDPAPILIDTWGGGRISRRTQAYVGHFAVELFLADRAVGH